MRRHTESASESEPTEPRALEPSPEPSARRDRSAPPSIDSEQALPKGANSRRSVLLWLGGGPSSSLVAFDTDFLAGFDGNPRSATGAQAASSMQARGIPWPAPLHLAEFPKQGLGESGFPSKPARNCPLRCRTVAGRRVERERQRAPKKREPAARADTRWAKAQTGQKRKRPAAEPHRTRRAQDRWQKRGRAAKRRTRQKKRHNEKARPAAEHPRAFVRG